VSESRFTGRSTFLLWLPWLMLAYGLAAALWSLSRGALGFAVVSGLVGWVISVTLPWRFEVRDDGLELHFAFGKHRFLPKREVTIRCRVGSPVALIGRSRRLGYPLTPGLLEARRQMLRSILIDTGYEVA
jgi:hypothetical protein